MKTKTTTKSKTTKTNSAPKKSAEKVFLYDTLLRDGAQTRGIDFSLLDKIAIAQEIDDLGIDYIEAGFAGANPTDDAFFANPPKLKNSKIVAFGMTHRPSSTALEDKGLQNIVNSKAKFACIVGKAWDFHVINALNTTLEKNLKMIENSIKHLSKKGLEVFFDAEHFFDGFKANQKYALQVAETAYKAGARWIILCDTNGGSLPHEVQEIVSEVTKKISGKYLGIHCHNDTENAVANSLAAVRAGARQVQGTINGYGERCGNANLISIIPTLKYKMDFDISISESQMKSLKKISDNLEDRLNRTPYKHAAYVGDSAFAHKGGMHVSAVVKSADAYEHIAPEKVGNKRIIVISDQAGRSNIIERLNSLKIKASDEKITELTKIVKQLENQGYAFDNADASFEILARKTIGKIPEFFDVRSFRIIDERRWNAKGKLIHISEAKAVISVGGKEFVEISEGDGPVDALTKAIKKAVGTKYPQINDIKLTDYKVRIMQAELGTGATTRVQIESTDNNGKKWTTIGVSNNILDASFCALNDSFVYKLLKK
jgi:2-isopropylmalate synthase